MAQFSSYDRGWCFHLWQCNRNHLISFVILLPASLCCFEIETLLDFTPDETEVSGQRSLAKQETESWCWRCTSVKHQKDVRCVPYGSLISFQQEVALVKGKLQWREQGRGSCWFTGAVWGFPHPSALQLRKQMLRRGSPQTVDCVLNHHLLTYHNKLQTRRRREIYCRSMVWEREKYREMATRKWNSMCTSFSLQSCLLTGDLRDEWLHWLTPTRWKHNLSPLSRSSIHADTHTYAHVYMQTFIQ